MHRFFQVVLLLLLPAVAEAESPSYGGKPFIRNISAEEYGGHNRNFDIECCDSGKVIVANFEGLLEWDGEKWSMSHTTGVSRITSLYKTPGGRIWFGGYNVLGLMSRGGGLSYVARETDVRENFGEVKDIISEGRLFFTAGEDQYILNNGILMEKCGTADDNYMIPSTWRGAQVNQTVPLKDLGLVAKATSTLGVVILDEEGNLVYKLGLSDGLCSDAVSALAYDGKGSLWGATDNGLFQIIISPVYSHYGPSDGLQGQVTSILKDCDGKLFAGTLQGLFLLGDDDAFHKVEGLDLACWDLAMSPEGKVFAATAQGVFKYDGELERISSGHALTILFEDGETFITGELEGIYRYRTDGHAEKLNSVQNVAKFVRSDDGGIWAINYFRETYLMKAGENSFSPAENQSLSLLFSYVDESGRVWHAGSDGKGLLSESLTERERSWCSALDDYSIEAMCFDEDVSYVGGLFGIMRIDVSALHHTETYEPSARICSFSQKEFTVKFFISSGKSDPVGHTEYSYRLDDTDSWSEWSTDPQVYLGTVGIGKHNLAVRCRDSYGNISVSESFPFEIEAPFFMKWYAWIFYCIVIGFVSWGTNQIRNRKIRKDRERLEILVEKRTKELKDVQGELIRKEREATVGKLTKGLIDRILNPMNYINNFSHLSIGLTKDLGDDLEDDKDNMSADIFDDCSDLIGLLKSNLEKIEQHGLATTRILKAMEELLKDHTGKVEECDILQTCVKDVEMFSTYNKDDIEELGIGIKTEFPSDPVLVQSNQINVSKVIMSMLANSVYALRKKFQKSQQAVSEKPVIRISLTPGEGGHGCSISIYDNGIGIEESIMDKIFDPFFTTKPTGEAPGVGLYLSRQVIQDLGGDIRVESRKDEYTSFTIELR